jgi:hypothetical protein
MGSTVNPVFEVEAPSAAKFEVEPPSDYLGSALEKIRHGGGTGDLADPNHPAHKMLEDAYNDIKAGNYSKGAHGLLAAAGEFLKPTLPASIAAAPITSALSFGTGLIGGKVAGAAAQAVGATPEQAQLAGDIGSIAGGGLVSKLGTAATKLAPGLYESALKPGTTIPLATREARIATGLEEGIPVSRTGSEKLAGLIDDLNEKVKAQIAADPNRAISRQAVAGRLMPTFERVSRQVNPEADVAAVAGAEQEFTRNFPAQIPAEQAQAAKVATYQELRKKYGQLGSATVESQKALARGLKEELANAFPELGGLNARESRLIGLDQSLERAVGRVGNWEQIGIGTPIAAGAAKAITGSGAMGVGIGALASVLRNPDLKSRLAISLNRQGVPLSVANRRIAAYISALESSGAGQPVSGQGQTP